MSLTVTARITRADQSANPYFYIPFDVPAGTTRIDVTLAYPKAEDCVIDLGAFDPRDTGYPTAEGFRGWSGGARDRFFIATDDATPGYIHGDIPTGRVEGHPGSLQSPRGGHRCQRHHRARLRSRDTRAAADPYVPRSPAGRAGTRAISTATPFIPTRRARPRLLHAAAKQAGLDFLAIADHNTITQRRYFHPASSPDLVFVRGMEITTAVGPRQCLWRRRVDRFPHDASPPMRTRWRGSFIEKGGLLSINHDKPTIPWDYELPEADCQEVWQSTWMAWNWVSLERYQQRLAAGLRLSAIGGSDYHQPDRAAARGPAGPCPPDYRPLARRALRGRHPRRDESRPRLCHREPRRPASR